MEARKQEKMMQRKPVPDGVSAEKTPSEPGVHPFSGPVRRAAWFAGLVFLVRSFAANRADVDIWGNVGFVRALPWSEGFLRCNTFSFTEPGLPWINHEWLSQYIFWQTFSIAGAGGLLVLKLALGGVLALLCLRYIRQRGRSGAIVFLMALLVLSNLAYGSSIRPQLFTYCLCAAYIIVLTRHAGSPVAMLMVLPTLGLLWCNLHGAFFIGALLLALAVVVHIVKRRFRFGALAAGALLLFAAASLVNPYGAGVWTFVVRSAGIARPYLHEWSAFGDVAGFVEHPDFVALILVMIFTLWSCRKQIPALQVVFLLLFCGAALVMLRNIPLFAICAFLLVTPALSDRWGCAVERVLGRFPPRLLVFGLTLFAGVSLVTTFTGKAHPGRIEVSREHFPVEAVRFLRDRSMAGRALVYFDWAEQFIWHLYPQLSVFIDGRFESAYTQKTIRDYVAFLENRATEVADRYDVDILLLPPELYVTAAMLRKPEWRAVAFDRCSVLLVRTNRYPDLTAFDVIDLSEPGEPVFFP